MELVIAPIVELRSQIAHSFEDLVGATLDRGAGMSDQPYTFSCALTGGSTAMIFLPGLRGADVDWSPVKLFWGDERAVPPDSPESNFGLANEMLLKPLGSRAPDAARMQAERPDIHYAAREYEAALPPALDLLILGVGEDGHVCSLFPGHPALMVQDARVTTIEDAPKPPPRRLTLTMPDILRSRNVWVVAVGERKRRLLQDAISRNAVATPIDLVVQQAHRLTVFTDQQIRSGFVVR